MRVRVLKGEIDGPAQPPVAVEALTARQASTEAKLDVLTEELRTLTALQRRSLWARIWSRCGAGCDATKRVFLRVFRGMWVMWCGVRSISPFCIIFSFSLYPSLF